jgi:nicotinate phosphoribosyltransferase
MIFHLSDEKDIKKGLITDVYFDRARKIMEARNLTRKATAEIRLQKFPEGWSWGVLAGVEEALKLLEDLPVEVDCLPEGTIFREEEPVLTIAGRYLDYAVYETALLGLLCQASGIATKSSRCRKAAENRPLISFGARRMHPGLAPMIERNAFIGGCDGVAVGKSAELIGESPSGTIPHALVLMMGGVVSALTAFDEIIDPAVRRVALVDTFSDEKTEALTVAEALGDRLFAVRLDTPSSRRGDMGMILREVRWELDLRGYRDVQLFVSGGVDEDSILELNEYSDAYGVGTSISNAPVINFSMDIVEIEGNPVAKRGKMSGRKKLLLCRNCRLTTVIPYRSEAGRCACGGEMEDLLEPVIEKGRLVTELPAPQKIREYVLSQLPFHDLS